MNAVPGPARGDVAHITLPDLIALGGPARSLRLRPRRRAAATSGALLSRMRGRGMEFDEVRPYQPGDDIRTMEWRITARTGRPHTKLFREERERPVLLTVDLGPAMFFATRGAFKSVVAARAAGLLAWAACLQGDRVGGLLFGSGDPVEIAPGRGQPGVLHFLRALAAHPAWQPGARAEPAALASTLQRLERVARPGSLIVLASDFRALTEDGRTALRRLGAHSDVMLLFVYDPFERDLPEPGVYLLTDGGGDRWLDTRVGALRARHRAAFEARVGALRALANDRGMALVSCETREDVLVTLRRALGRP